MCDVLLRISSFNLASYSFQTPGWWPTPPLLSGTNYLWSQGTFIDWSMKYLHYLHTLQVFGFESECMHFFFYLCFSLFSLSLSLSIYLSFSFSLSLSLSLPPHRLLNLFKLVSFFSESIYLRKTTPWSCRRWLPATLPPRRALSTVLTGLL